MEVSLTKGQGVSLRKEQDDLNTLTMGLGLDVAKPQSGLLGRFFGEKEEEYGLKEIARYDISGDDSYSQYHAITFAEVVRDGNSWKFDAIGTPHTDSSIVDLLRNYLDQ